MTTRNLQENGSFPTLNLPCVLEKGGKSRNSLKTIEGGGVRLLCGGEEV